MSYPDGKTMIGHFGFNTEYINQVHLWGLAQCSCKQIFTIPDNMENELIMNHLNKVTLVKTQSGIILSYILKIF